MPSSEHDWKGDPDRPEDEDVEEVVVSPTADAWQEVAKLPITERLIPVFPLPAVLFPRVSLPLYVFEERYQALAADVLGADRALAIALHEEDDPDGGPREICTVGVITHVEELDEGELNLLVTGSHRARITDLVDRHPYLTARVVPIREPVSDDPGLPAATAALRTLASQWVFLQDESGAEDLIQRISLVSSPGALADYLAHHLFGDASLKQEVLETVDESRRVMRVHALISAALDRLAEEKAQ